MTENECISFGNYLLENYITISGGWWHRENPKGRAIPTSEVFELYLLQNKQKQ